MTQRSRIIGVIVGDIVDPYFAEITRGIEDVGAKAGYLTIVCNADRRTELEQAQMRLLTDYHAEGVIFAGSGYADDERGAELAALVDRARSRGMNVLSLATRDFECPRVLVDNHAAAYDLTDYLISLGQRRIAFIGGPAGLHTSASGWPGSRRRWTAPGSTGDILHEGDFTYDLGHAAALRMLAGAQLPDAVIGANDETAIGAITALRQAGVAIPRRDFGRGDDRHPPRAVQRPDHSEYPAVPVRRDRRPARDRGRARRRAARDRPSAPARPALDHGAARASGAAR